jgi:alpha-L-arabinofuranosidase
MPQGLWVSKTWDIGVGLEIDSRRALIPKNMCIAGMRVQQGWRYTGSFYAKTTDYHEHITVSLQSASGKVYASKKISGNPTSTYRKYTFSLSPSESAPDGNNTFVVELDGDKGRGSTIHFGLFSLFPPTYKGHPNGLRIDLAEAMAATKPGVWRFPGGNNLEGATFDTRWKWNETIGPCVLNHVLTCFVK